MTEPSFTSTSTLVNARLDQQTGISAFGTLVHLARLNHFHRSDFLAAFGLRFQHRDDLSNLLAFSMKRRLSLACTTTTTDTPPVTWGVEPWQPFPSLDRKSVV